MGTLNIIDAELHFVLTSVLWFASLPTKCNVKPAKQEQGGVNATHHVEP